MKIGFLLSSFVSSRNCQGILDGSLAFKLAHDPSAIGACGGLSKGFRPTLPDPSETFVAEIASVMRKIGVGDERRDGSIGDLVVRVVRPHDPVYVADHDRFDLERAEFAMTASRMVVSVGFNLNKRG